MTQSTAATADLKSADSFASRAKLHRRTVGAPDIRLTVRSLDIAMLQMDDTVARTQLRVPALPVFDDTFAAFSHGTVLSGTQGSVAIEDVQPGEMLETHDGPAAKVLWVASSTVLAADTPRPISLIRVMPDSFGMGRPHAFTTFGPAARMLQTPHHLRGTHAGASMLTRLPEFADGTNVIEVTPPTAVRLFHIGCDRHAVINAGGLLMESYHPQLETLQNLSHSMRSVFLSMFPHVTQFADFGPLAHMRAPETQDNRIIA